MPESGSYEGVTPRHVPLPQVVEVGEWWRSRWRFRSLGVELERFSVPPPWGDIDSTSLFVSCWWDGDVLVTDVLSRTEAISGESLTCVSMIAAWFEYKAGANNVEVDGIMRHPVLKLSQIESWYVEQMEALGY